MTGPTGHLLSPDAPTSHLRRLLLELDNNTNDTIIKSNINLHDPSTVWPSRSLERRRAFQHLLNRYNRQILYGCKNPRCETPTCLSHQKRVARGPFRPYTVLSARTLASFLASQDHPERGLCPHEQVNIDQGPRSPAKEGTFLGKTPEKRKNLFAIPRSSHAIPASDPASGIGVSPDLGRQVKIHIADAHTKRLEVKPEIPTTGGHGALKDHHRIRKDKDPKSFTQNLFDTIAMRLLHRTDASDIHTSWSPSNERAQHKGSSNLNRNSVETRIDVNVSKRPEKVQATPSIVDAETTRAALTPYLPLVDANPKNVCIESSNTSSEIVPSNDLAQGSTCLQKDLAKSEASDTDSKAHTAANIESQEATYETGTLSSKMSQSDPKSDGLGAAATTPLQQTSPPAVTQPIFTSKMTAQSLSHFTKANIIALRQMRAACHSDLHEQHCLLKFLGRTDLPRHSSECGLYGDFLAYSGQSITYILSNVDALLQSFLLCDDSTATPRTVRSYDFPLIVDLFRKLRRIDMHPLKIFPNLWISAGKLYPLPTTSNKRRPLTPLDLGLSSIHPPTISHGLSLNDLEACHVVKIILAALVSSVPKCSPIGWLAVRKLHASGQVAPFVDPDDSPAERKTIGRLVRTLHAFENEMALNLVIRLARSIDIRYHLARARALAEDAEKNRRQFPHTFSRVIDYVNTDNLKICVADDEGQVSIKNSEWVDPEVEPITWHPKEWPIIIEWLRAVILKEWDGKARIAEGSAVGGALGLMLHIHEHASALSFDWDIFHTPFLSERLDVMDEPAAWLNAGWADGRTEVHLLDFPFLFPPSALVSYFRSINHAAMYLAYRDAVAASRLCHTVTWPDLPTGRGSLRLHDRLHCATTEYLVLEARRDHILMDAMNEIYRRQKRELMRPLKVRMVGEEGIDHGGVQQEFFRVAIAEALNPDYGVFTTDPTTRMSWFHPSSAEPAYKFELLGILVSLAVYNGLTLPFTFPLVMYRKLSGLHSHMLSDLEDGWPELVKGLRALRDWKDGDVEDVFMRTYVFSIDKFGATEDRLIGQYEEAEQGDEDESEIVRSKGKKVVKVLRIKRKLRDADKTAIEQGEEDALRYLRGGQLQEATAESNSEVSTSDSQSHVPQPTRFGDPNMAIITNEEEALEYLKSRETKKARGVAEEQLCISDSSLPQPPSEAPASQTTPMVTNENRDQYIRDYIHQLTYKTVYNQFNAFRYGFFTCFQPKAISLFTPSALKALVEGLPDVSVAGLERVTRYDGGYDFFHPTVRQFWNVVHSWPQERVRKLLEFVTASDRLPVGGVGKLIFTIQKNGIGDGRLPTSLTCFGRLLLPEYTSEEKMQEALEKAVENSKGFGQP